MNLLCGLLDFDYKLVRLAQQMLMPKAY